MSNNYRKTRLAQGLCINCGARPHLDGIQVCNQCKTTHAKGYKTRRAKHAASNVCITAGCGKPIDGNARCTSCREKHRQFMQSRRDALTADGLCHSCRTGTALNNHLCETCHFKSVAKRLLKDRSQWMLLRDKWEAQGHCCPYSGLPIVLGQTAHLDHIIPRAKGGQDTIDNLQWTHEWINKMKSDLMPDEFVSMLCKFIKQVSSHLCC